MGEPRYTVEYDTRLGCYRWQVAPGERLQVPSRPSGGRALRVVALGGGTGLPILLRGLKTALFPPGRTSAPNGNRHGLTAIVTVTDDGGSSGRLRRAYRVLPPGDIRNCLLALSDGESTMAAIFNFRFSDGGELGGHCLGNLILTALNELERDSPAAVARGSEILAVRGRVLPSTVEHLALRAEFADGSSAEGESRIASARHPIRRLSLHPDGARAFPPALEAIAAADVIVIGPGSLYTSLISVLLVEEIAEAIARSRARVVLVMNLMTEPGETDGYTAADHCLAIRRHTPGVPIHAVLLNAAPLPGELLTRYGADGAVPVPAEAEPLRALGCRPVVRDLLGGGPKIRHDPRKLARAILELASEVAA